MKRRLNTVTLALATALGSLTLAVPALAQVAGGTTTTGVRITEVTQLATGWSVKKTLLGKNVYNDAGQKIGKVEDLIIAPDRNVSFVIVGAGGFIGIGRHDVAIAVDQIQDKAGRLVMSGATKDSLKALPVFVYADDGALRQRFVAGAEQDIARSKVKLAQMERAAGAATADAKARIDTQITNVQAELKSTEAKLGEMKQAAAARWHEFEAGVSAATARLRKSIDNATT